MATASSNSNDDENVSTAPFNISSEQLNYISNYLGTANTATKLAQGINVKESQVLDKELFLQALRDYKCLWDTSHPNYKNRNVKMNAWNELSGKFNQEVQHVQKTLKNLKDSLKKCLDKRNAMTKSGSAAGTLPTCKYFEAMRFLHGKASNLPTHSSVDIDIHLGQSPTEVELHDNNNEEEMDKKN